MLRDALPSRYATGVAKRNNHGGVAKTKWHIAVAFFIRFPENLISSLASAKNSLKAFNLPLMPHSEAHRGRQAPPEARKKLPESNNRYPIARTCGEHCDIYNFNGT
jgi:hypothetical protein